MKTTPEAQAWFSEKNLIIKLTIPLFFEFLLSPLFVRLFEVNKSAPIVDGYFDLNSGFDS